MEIRDHRAAPAEEAGPETQLTDDALVESAPLSESSPEDLEEGVLEERRVPRVIPRVEPRTTEDLPTEPPAKQRYPVKVRHALAELWRSRELLFGLVERDLRVRYKQAILGMLWAVVNPLLTMVLFTFVFGKIARFQNSITVPYPIFAYSALVPWSLFQSATNYSVNAVISNAPIIRKIYCPREVFPIGAVISSGADFLISLAILFAMCFSYGFFPTWVWLALIPLLVALVVMLLALSMIFSVAVAYFRDVRYVVPSVLSVLLFLTPIAYPLNRLASISLFRNHPGLIKAYSYINPLAPIIDGFRRVLVFNQWPEWSPFGFATALSVVGLMVAYRWYKQVDGYLADVI